MLLGLKSKIAQDERKINQDYCHKKEKQKTYDKWCDTHRHPQEAFKGDQRLTLLFGLNDKQI